MRGVETQPGGGSGASFLISHILPPRALKEQRRATIDIAPNLLLGEEKNVCVIQRFFRFRSMFDTLTTFDPEK